MRMFKVMNNFNISCYRFSDNHKIILQVAQAIDGFQVTIGDGKRIVDFTKVNTLPEALALLGVNLAAFAGTTQVTLCSNKSIPE